ncbi:MAG: hypothetical protein AABY83_01305 [Pseudomonadota bacterium]
MNQLSVADAVTLPKPNELIEEIADAVRRWPEFAKAAGVAKNIVREIGDNHRLQLD